MPCIVPAIGPWLKHSLSLEDDPAVADGRNPTEAHHRTVSTSDRPPGVFHPEGDTSILLRRGTFLLRVDIHDILSSESFEATAAALSAHGKQPAFGALLSIDETGARVRILPLRR